MVTIKDVLSQFRIAPDTKVKLKNFDPGWEGDKKLPEAERRRAASDLLERNIEELAEAQELLFAADSWSLLVVLQAMDAAGKDGTIKHVMSGVNPQGVRVTSFKQPSDEELDHDFLWRCSKELPQRGQIGIFNRSYYEEVLTVKVHKEHVANERIPNADPGRKKFWKSRYESINDFERHLTRNGTRVIKIYLHVSRDEQKRRLLERINDPKKNWKFSANDLIERALWDDYMSAFESMIRATSTSYAPWFIVPADKKWVCRSLVAEILAYEIRQLDLKFPIASEEQLQILAQCRQQLESETPPPRTDAESLDKG
jgi:PPK2 family polyphosphate:nucleotide phosphotransferase